MSNSMLSSVVRLNKDFVIDNFTVPKGKYTIYKTLYCNSSFTNGNSKVEAHSGLWICICVSKHNTWMPYKKELFLEEEFQLEFDM